MTKREEKPEARSQKPGEKAKPVWRFVSSSGSWLLASGFCLLIGCAGDPPETGYDRTQRALDDPMGYKPDMRGTDVAGGKELELDKEGLKRDLDHVFMR